MTDRPTDRQTDSLGHREVTHPIMRAGKKVKVKNTLKQAFIHPLKISRSGSDYETPCTYAQEADILAECNVSDCGQEKVEEERK